MSTREQAVIIRMTEALKDVRSDIDKLHSRLTFLYTAGAVVQLVAVVIAAGLVMLTL